MDQPGTHKLTEALEGQKGVPKSQENQAGPPEPRTERAVPFKRRKTMIEPGTHKLTEALEGQVPAPLDASTQHHGPSESGRPDSTPREVAEEVRREQESQHNGKNDLDRDDYFVQIGRGEQTHG